MNTYVFFLMASKRNKLSRGKPKSLFRDDKSTTIHILTMMVNMVQTTITSPLMKMKIAAVTTVKFSMFIEVALNGIDKELGLKARSRIMVLLAIKAIMASS
ncbi:unnamed protein product [Parnassius apollo]|uniref:(apollo) hypothetical protein n=1 Tax=Parnassius apollo TaxID=110799 RepID=A0A8S3XB89_PARAO|nr:unnamed protein product [Parnassius apollo]